MVCLNVFRSRFQSANNTVGYAELLSTVSEQSDSALESVREIFTSSLPGFLSKFAALSEEDLSKVR